MATPGTLTTPRGQRSLYIHFRDNDDLGYTDPDYIYNSETNESALPEFDGITQSVLNNYNNADFNTIDVDPGAGVHNRVLTYNPITDQYGISEGQYVL